MNKKKKPKQLSKEEIEKYVQKGTENIEEAFNMMLILGSPYNTKYMFYAHILAMCQKVIDINFPAPAGVWFDHNKYYIGFNPIYYYKMSLKERLGIFKHEALHICNGHIFRCAMQKLDKEKYNIATDCAINQQIEKDHLPLEAVFPENFPTTNKNLKKNESAEYYYYEIDQKQFEKEYQNNEQNSNNNVDFHDKWGNKNDDPEMQKDVAKRMVDRATEKTVNSVGELPNNIKKILELFNTKSQITWQKVLKNITGNKKVGTRQTYLRRNRRFLKRLDVKGKIKDRKFTLLVIDDVSGSVSNGDQIFLINEIKNIAKLTDSDVNLIQIDTEAYPPEKITKNTKIITRKGNGGTNLFPGIEKAKEHKLEYNAVVVATDGYLFNDDINKFKELKVPVIWLIATNGEIAPEMQTGRMRAYKLKGEKK